MTKSPSPAPPGEFRDAEGRLAGLLAGDRAWSLLPGQGAAPPWLARITGVGACCGLERRFCPATPHQHPRRLVFELAGPGLYQYGRWARSHAGASGRAGFLLVGSDGSVEELDRPRALALARELQAGLPV